MIRFAHPEALLLLAPLVLVLWRAAERRPLVRLLRLLLALFACCLLAWPYATGREEGRDLILVIDRSRSVPPDGTATVEEIATSLRDHVQAGDRIGMVSFGRRVAAESVQREGWQYRPPIADVDPDGSDVRAALDTALAMIPPQRRGSILLFSDGESTGADPATAARDALRRGIRIDAVHLARSGMFDLAVDELQTPAEVGGGEPFQFSTWVRCDRPVDVPVRLLRDGVEIAKGVRRLRAGRNRVVFRDVVREPGVHRYEVEVPLDDDPVRENNRARSVVRVTGPSRVLCVTPRGREDRLTRSLAAAGIRVVRASPGGAPLNLDALDGFRAVVLENVAAGDLPSRSVDVLARWVRDFGGGVLMTGGKASFGPGGYHRTPLEDVLPVSLEIRQEQRKFGLAMAIALDRSGSMAAPVAGGQTKMDLANLGACAAIELLGRIDSVAVLAIDSRPHVVVAMTDADPREPLLAKVRSIESSGGGIFTFAALQAAARQLAAAEQTSKHIVLFADAADAEEPGDYQALVPDLVEAGVTVSVIGLGRDTDSDADFLKDVARLGNGRCFFVEDATELPRVFAQETIQVARSSVVEERTGVAATAGLLALSPLLDRTFPDAGGYSIAYLKNGAELGARTTGEQGAPFFSFWQHGLGRSAAFLGEADGALSGGLASWDGYGDFFATVVRWLAGTDVGGDVFCELERRGHEAVLSVEVEAGEEAKLGRLRALVTGADGKAGEVVLQRVGERRLEARVPLRGEGVYRAVVDTGDGGFLRVPPITLPYSPEFEHRLDPRSGERTLERITRIAEGRVNPPAGEILQGSRASAGVTPLAPLCAWITLALLLLEVAVRRLQLALPPGWLGRLRLPRLRRRPAAAPSPEAPSPEAAGPEQAGEGQEPGAVPEKPLAAQRGIAGVLERARARGGRRRS